MVPFPTGPGRDDLERSGVVREIQAAATAERRKGDLASRISEERMDEDVPREAENRWYSPGVIATLMGLPDLPVIGSQEFLTRKDGSTWTSNAMHQKFKDVREEATGTAKIDRSNKKLGAEAFPSFEHCKLEVRKEEYKHLGDQCYRRSHLLDVFGEPKFSLRKYFQHIKWFANKLKFFNPSKGSKIESGEVCCWSGKKTGTPTNLQNPNVVVLLESRISTSSGRGRRILLKSPTQSTNRRLASQSGFSATYNGKSSRGNLIFDRYKSSQKIMSRHLKTKTNNHFEGAGYCGVGSNSLAEMFYLTDLEAHSVDNITRIDTRALWGSEDSSSINQPMPSALPALSATYASRTFSNIRQFGDEQLCTPDDGLKWRNENFNQRGKLPPGDNTSSNPSEKKCQRLVHNAISENIKVSCSITEETSVCRRNHHPCSENPIGDLLDAHIKTWSVDYCRLSDDDDDGGGEEQRSFLEEEFRDEEERDYSYLLDMLIASGIHNAKRSDLPDACYSSEYPLKPALFARLEKKYRKLAAWSPSERKLMFDSTNMILAAMLAPCLDKRPWVKATTRIRPMWGAEGLLEKTWQLLVGKRVEANVGNSDSTAMDEEWLELGDEMDGLGMVIERLVWEDLLEELVLVG
ncbi:uncharacterized protein LOC122008614 isoform X1 [Zingiber officinale]|uniref:uncharacterized protein LOC122008614 isoform X1 n=2 Tax=Zingiber officinale TaxID=94328 RepID=UPI001C4B95FF|nr:uncharacterized protein LOC122008614 isoform X1 [Zingiber officinale]